MDLMRRNVVVGCFLVTFAWNAAWSSPPAKDENDQAQSRPSAAGWDQTRPELRDGILAQAKALGQTPDEFLERIFLRHLADKVTETYSAMTDLTIESQVYISTKKLDGAKDRTLEVDAAAPLAARVRWRMKPNQRFRAEAYVNDKVVWGMVSSDETLAPNKRSIAVQWTASEQTQPYEEGLFVDDRWVGSGQALPTDAIPGRCTVGVFMAGWLGGSEYHKNSIIYNLFRDRIRNGRYMGITQSLNSTPCHTIGYDIVEPDHSISARFYYFIDINTYSLLEEDIVNAMRLYGSGQIIGSQTNRMLFLHSSTEPIPDEAFKAPDPGDRRLVDMKELFP
jgi:hypothetical protein